jgi:hypothetical protein
MLHLPDAIFHMAYEQTSRGRRTERLAGIDWRWAPLAMVSDVLSYVVQAALAIALEVGRKDRTAAGRRSAAPTFFIRKLVTPDEKRVYSSRVR